MYLSHLINMFVTCLAGYRLMIHRSTVAFMVLAYGYLIQRGRGRDVARSAGI